MQVRNGENIVTEKECFEIVKKKLIQDSINEFSLLNYEVTPLSSTTGYMGEYFTLKTIVSKPALPTDTKDLKFFIKLPPLSDCAQNRLNLEVGSYQKELNLYTKVFPSLMVDNAESCIPRCYLALSDIMVLEDLVSQGYGMPNKFVHLDLNHCKIMMKSLAKFHASSLIFEEIHKKNIYDEFSYCLHESLWPPVDKGVTNEIYVAAVKGVLSMIDLITDIEESKKIKFKKILAEMIKTHRNNLQPSKKHRNVICHGDLWANNIMFKCNSDGEAVSSRLVDFQLARYNPPAHDVLYFLTLTTTKKLRDDHNLELYQIYYNQLTKSLRDAGINNTDKVLSWEAFNNSLADLSLTLKLQTLLNLNVMLLDSNIIERCFTCDAKLWEYSIFTDRSQLICAQFENFTKYRERMIEAALDLYNDVMNHTDC